MSKTIKVIALLLCAALSAAVFASCVAVKPPEPGQETPEPTKPPVIIGDSEYWLVKDSKTEYKLVISAAPGTNELYAEAEFKKYFKLATGIIIKSVTDAEAAAAPDGAYISLDRNAYFSANAGVVAATQGLEMQDYLIKRDGKNVFITGGSTLGTVFGVFGFLERQFGLRVYYRSENDTLNEVAIEKNVTKKKLLDFDYTVSPDIPNRGAWGPNAIDAEFAHSMGFGMASDIFAKTGAEYWHNTLDFAPLDKFNTAQIAKLDEDGKEVKDANGKTVMIPNPDYHPDWYVPKRPGIASDYVQLSVTAKGNAAELEALREQVYTAMIAFIENSLKIKPAEYIMFTQMDGSNWESGSSMDYFRSKYGNAANAASLIYFINPIAKRVAEYMAENHSGRKMDIMVFAYSSTIEAPVNKVGDSYVPMSDEVVLEKNVSILYAPIAADYTKPLTDTVNAPDIERINKWKALTDHISFWLYSQYYYHVMIFYDNIGSLAENFKFIKEYCDPVYIFNESTINKASVGFTGLKEYIVSRLGWDVTLNVDELTEDYFNNYFKAAAPEMLELFGSLRAYYADVLFRNILPTDPMIEKPDQAEYWPLGVIDTFLAKFDKALAAAESLKDTDIFAYQSVCDRINAEKLMFRYLRLALYSKALMADGDYADELNSFRADCAKWGIKNIGYTGKLPA